MNTFFIAFILRFIAARKEKGNGKKEKEKGRDAGS